jgi:hypothetical protein
LNVTGPQTLTNTFDLIPNVAQGGQPARANTIRTQQQVAENISLPMGFNVDGPTKSTEKASMLTRVKERRSPTVRLFQLSHNSTSSYLKRKERGKAFHPAR